MYSKYVELTRLLRVQPQLRSTTETVELADTCLFTERPGVCLREENQRIMLRTVRNDACLAEASVSHLILLLLRCRHFGGISKVMSNEFGRLSEEKKGGSKSTKPPSGDPGVDFFFFFKLSLVTLFVFLQLCFNTITGSIAGKQNQCLW